MAQDKFSIPTHEHLRMQFKDVVLRDITVSGYSGLTWKEIERRYGRGHSTVSSALSGLHRKGKVERLAEKREGCSIYVVPLQGSMRGREVIARRTFAVAAPSEDHTLCEATEATLLSTIDALQRQVEEYEQQFRLTD